MSNPPVPRLKNMVEICLQANYSYQGISCRDSDIALMICIWIKWYSVSDLTDGTIHVRRLFDLPREDNIKRVRAVFQNVEAKYLPTSWKVAQKRGFEREAWEAALGYNLSREEVIRYKENEKETTPPKFTIPKQGYVNRKVTINNKIVSDTTKLEALDESGNPRLFDIPAKKPRQMI